MGDKLHYDYHGNPFWQFISILPSPISALKYARAGLFGLGAFFSLTAFATPALALAGGALLALGLGNPWPQVTATLGSRLLQVAIVGLGLGIPLDALIRAGSTGVSLTIVLIAAVFAAGIRLGRWMGVSATCRCSSPPARASAEERVAALGSAIGASREAMSVALATVFVLNSIALYVFPPIGHLLHLSQHQFGVWAALAIHDTSSVVGAAASYGPLALEEATILKLARALWILPLALLAPRMLRRPSTTEAQPRRFIPWFIGLFVLAAVARSFATPGAIGWFDAGAQAGRTALVLTLFLIGANLTRTQLRAVGLRPFLHGLVLWIGVGSVTLAFALLGVR
jgi:uncharacterized membrane protein YadS